MRLKNGISTYWKLSVPVELARKQELAEATTFDTLAWGGESPRMTDGHPALPSRQVKDGTEGIAFRVDWANYRDDHLKERFGELLKWLRVTKSGMETGSDSIPTEPKPNKIGKKALVLDKALTCLRAARVLHHCHGKSPDVAWQMLGLSQGAFDKETSNFYRDAFWLHSRTIILSSFLLLAGVSLVLAQRTAQGAFGQGQDDGLVTALLRRDGRRRRGGRANAGDGLDGQHGIGRRGTIARGERSVMK